VTVSELGIIASLALNLGLAIAGATWGISKIKDAVRDAMDKHREEYSDQLTTLARGFNDTFAALRQHINDVDGKLWKKISEVELDTAKHYMRKDSFYQVKGEMSGEIKEFRTELKERLDRLENKIDTKT
jgi:methyl-accepting chemotaxis protein